MAGSSIPDPVPTNHSEAQNSMDSHSEISPIIEQWQIKYARFINYNSAGCASTHPSLVAFHINRHRSGAWISSSSFTICLKLRADRSNGFPDAVLAVCLGSRLLEEHYISKLQFSWPQVSCVSGFPSRGSRIVFVGYLDGLGQIQKFAIRFLTNIEAEVFMNVLKDILDGARIPGLPWESDTVYQADSAPSIGPAYRPEGDWQFTTSADTNTHPLTPNDNSPASNPQGSSEKVADGAPEVADGDILSAFPPSFTSLVMKCYAAPNKAKPAETQEADLKTQIMQYLEGSSLKDIVATVENVIKELGDDIVL